MARPCKSAKVLTDGSQTKGEIESRVRQEERLRGEGNHIRPPVWLSEGQRKIFGDIVAQLEESGILGNLDIYILAQCSVAIDRVQYIENRINLDSTLLMDATFMASKDKYTKDLYRCCNELSLSPQSRAKMANISLQAKREEGDPLLRILQEDA